MLINFRFQVNTASEEARNATQAVKTLQQSVVILEKRAIRRVRNLNRKTCFTFAYVK